MHIYGVEKREMLGHRPDAGIKEKLRDGVEYWWDKNVKEWIPFSKKKESKAVAKMKARLESLATMRGLLAEV